ncbi:MAG: hypothetical protein ACRDBH_02050 [Bosea sp. (in: a-proteobacteria)]
MIRMVRVEAESMNPASKAKRLILWALLLWPCAGGLYVAMSLAALA